ncbi:MAG: MFS transporter [Deltaproteobacteria bacterium]|nr:MFS transporter [Deltaproteobacteria bacterium]MBW2153333.1 MFS transporter [Deltaproteobacteria bacterium]
MGDCALYTLLPNHYANIGLVPFQVGILLSANRWVRLISNHLAERAFRRIAPAPLLAGAFLLTSLITAAYGYFRAFALLLAARILWGVCLSFIRQAGMMTVVRTSAGSHLGRRMGLHRGLTLSGFLVGTLLGGLCYDTFGFASTFFTFSMLSLLGLPLGLLSQRHGARIEPVVPAGGSRKTDPRILVCGFALGLVGFGMIMSTLGLIIKQRAGISVDFFGIAVGAATLTGTVLAIQWTLDIIGSPLLGAVGDRIGRRRCIPLVYAGGAGLLGCAGFSSGTAWMLVCVVLFFCCAAQLSVMVSACAGELGPKGVASYLTAHDFGSAVGPLIGWGLAQIVLSADTVFLTGALSYLVGALASNRLLRSDKRPGLKSGGGPSHALT